MLARIATAIKVEAQLREQHEQAVCELEAVRGLLSPETRATLLGLLGEPAPAPAKRGRRPKAEG